MLFNSLDFALFFAVVFLLCALLRPQQRWMVFLPASYYFYMSWNAKYAFLILTSTVVAYACAIGIAATESPARRRGLLWVTLGVNLGLLFVFKYANFAIDATRETFALFGVPIEARSLDLLLPVGISFYTFQTLSYAIDVSRGNLKPERHFGHFALFVSFFPQLVAGPIERGKSLLPQLREPRAFDWQRGISGLQLVLWGLFKKVVVADRCGLYVDGVYAQPELFSGPDIAAAIYLFAFQIYCDFSAYSDIAIGTARVFGIDLTTNFRLPFFAKTLPEFWQRWHITLMNWLRDYVYLPLVFRDSSVMSANRNAAGSSAGRPKIAPRPSAAWTYFSTLVLMTLSGVWHGAAWTFVVWGIVQGLLMVASAATLPTRDRIYRLLGLPTQLIGFIRIAITFHLCCLSMVIFRAGSIADLMTIFARLPQDWSHFPDVPRLAIPACALLWSIELVQFRWPKKLEAILEPLPVRWAIAYAALFAIILIGVDQEVQFIYFQF